MQPPIAKRTAFIPVSSRHYPKKKEMRCGGHVPPAKPGKAGGLLVAGPSKGSGRNRICEKPSTTTLAATCTSMTTIARGSREQKQQRAVKRDPANPEARRSGPRSLSVYLRASNPSSCADSQSKTKCILTEYCGRSGGWYPS